jgi:nucleotide sugar dehydrogenase
LANQFALFAESNGIDVQKVIDASNSQPFSHIHRPGIAVGGHCIPVYPRFYIWNDPTATVVQAARNANEAMPARVVETLIKIHGDLKGQSVVVLGAAYRGGVKEIAFSGVFPTVSELEKYGAIVFVHDPMFSDKELAVYGFNGYHYGESVDAAILQTDHAEYQELTCIQIPGIKTFLDGRGVTNENNWQGLNYHVLGKPL